MAQWHNGATAQTTFATSYAKAPEVKEDCGGQRAQRRSGIKDYVYNQYPGKYLFINVIYDAIIFLHLLIILSNFTHYIE